jgi:hypothetical protein
MPVEIEEVTEVEGLNEEPKAASSADSKPASEGFKLIQDAESSMAKVANILAKGLIAQLLCTVFPVCPRCEQIIPFKCSLSHVSSHISHRICFIAVRQFETLFWLAPRTTD